MSYCINCGSEIDNHAEFCPNCGAPNSFTPIQADFSFKTVKNDRVTYGALLVEDIPDGFIIDGRYYVKKKFGQGGFSTVYQTFDRFLSVDKALKVIPNCLAVNKDAMTDLGKEIRTMVTLSHEAIIRVYDLHDSGNIKYIDMEFVDGKALSEIIINCEGAPLSEQKVREMAVKMIEGFAYAHDKGVIHKNITPQKIIVTEKGDVKIIYFGFAETFRTYMSCMEKSSSSDPLVYMAPEKLNGVNINKETDIYSFGAVLYELLSGHPLFQKGTIKYKILNEQPRPIKGVSNWMNEFVLKCLEKDYKKRFRSFNEVKAVLAGNELEAQEPYRTSSSVDTESFSGIISDRNMVLVESGNFRMGSNDGDSIEKPEHSVTISSFYISRYEVTQELWNEVMGSNPSETERGIGNNNPVNNVSWYDAVSFCNKLSQQEDLETVYCISGTNVTCDWSKNGYRLPTEAEWEYAARGGKMSKGYFFAGSNSISDVAWYVRNSRQKTHPVGQKQSNEIGLFDMSGNVSEWCWDWFWQYSSGRKRDPRGPASGQILVARGGFWNSNLFCCRTTCRDIGEPTDRSGHLGFRLARSAD